MNAGNYGLPVVLFAFGQNALGYASLFFVINAGLTYTLGTLIASMSTMSFGKALVNLIKLPLIYAMLLAVLFIYTGWKIPLPLERATKLLGDASIPSMLVLLGLQLKTANILGKIKPVGADIEYAPVSQPAAGISAVTAIRVDRRCPASNRYRGWHARRSVDDCAGNRVQLGSGFRDRGSFSDHLAQSPDTDAAVILLRCLRCPQRSFIIPLHRSDRLRI